MSRLTKGAIATAAGVTLLLGGAGTFALWNDTIAVDGDSSITTGQLRFVDDSVSGTWHDVSVNPDNLDELPGGFQMVPGDTVEFRGTVEVLASGNNLEGVLGVDSDSIVLGGDASPISIDILFTEGVIVRADDGAQTHSFVLTIRWPMGAPAGVDGQNATIDLSDVQFTLTQQRPSPA